MTPKQQFIAYYEKKDKHTLCKYLWMERRQERENWNDIQERIADAFVKEVLSDLTLHISRFMILHNSHPMSFMLVSDHLVHVQNTARAFLFTAIQKFTRDFGRRSDINKIALRMRTEGNEIIRSLVGKPFYNHEEE